MAPETVTIDGTEIEIKEIDIEIKETDDGFEAVERGADVEDLYADEIEAVKDAITHVDVGVFDTRGKGDDAHSVMMVLGGRKSPTFDVHHPFNVKGCDMGRLADADVKYIAAASTEYDGGRYTDLELESPALLVFL